MLNIGQCRERHGAAIGQTHRQARDFSRVFTIAVIQPDAQDGTLSKRREAVEFHFRRAPNRVEKKEEKEKKE
ncbi:MAG: hypothetical protein A3G34_16810 [Candidatus Lindowbacteria bacterium RIFCSPLOWO2_12_FULL_62_27]|nr:MAG: hypothetical protein A3I06_02120 [Candidatus Lindowbacteria bacterium RIFCSPLOWO2_02_FULL_62_12]OGH62889.1 MAG: hypothetical protein A3G34_16810 [Candidatus Lindowbacteria bacterium RIFCSPLOWO2_12_FULL_62_27]